MVSTSSDNLSILVVGQPHGALPSIAQGMPGVVICREAADAVRLAAQQSFSAIAVVMSSFHGDHARLIADLHNAGGSARLVLLARMYEEPLARELMSSCRNGAGPFVTDYLICPAEPSEIIGAGQDNPAVPLSVLPGASTSPDAMDQLIRMATEDYLTGLRNRRYLDEFLIQVIERARRGSTEVTLLLLDIDGLKRYNDTWGHRVGDSVLRQAATYIKKCCRSHDVVARVGGDEFAVVFWNVPPRQQGGDAHSPAGMDERRLAAAEHPGEAEIIERFRAHLSGIGLPLLGPAGIGTLTMSGGLATFPRDGAGADELFLAADAALLQAKRSGKNRIYLVGQGD